jgi:hypothetical protein
LAHNRSRFLRARRWIVAEAYEQFRQTEEWRAANQLNVLYDSIDVEAYEQSRRLVSTTGTGAIFAAETLTAVTV